MSDIDDTEKAYIVFPNNDGASYEVDLTDPTMVANLNTIIASAEDGDAMGEALLKILRMDRRITLHMLQRGTGANPSPGESMVNEETGDHQLAIADIINGGIKILDPIGDIRARLDQMDNAGFPGFLAAISNNLDVNVFTFTGDKIIFDKHINFGPEVKAYSIHNYPVKTIKGSEVYPLIVPDNPDYDTVGDYYKALAEFESFPILGTINNGETVDVHTSSIIGVENGFPMPAKVIDGSLLESGKLYKVIFYDGEYKQIGYPTTFSAQGEDDPAILVTQAYDYRITGFTYFTSRDTGGVTATLMQGENPYDSLNANYFLNFAEGYSKNISSQSDAALVVTFFLLDIDDNRIPVTAQDPVSGKFIVDTLNMSIGDRFIMRATYTVSASSNIIIEEGVTYETAGDDIILSFEKEITIVEDIYDRTLAIMTIPYETDGGSFRIKTIALGIDGSINDVTDAVLAPAPATQLDSTNGGDHTRVHRLKQGNTEQYNILSTVNFSTLAYPHADPKKALDARQYRVRITEVDNADAKIDNPAMVFGNTEGGTKNGMWFNAAERNHDYKAIPIQADIRAEDIYFWIDPVKYTELLGPNELAISSNVKDADTGNYESMGDLPTHFTIRSVKDLGMKYISLPQRLDNLKSAPFLLGKRYNGNDRPGIGDPLLIELYRDDPTTGMKAIGMLPAYIINNSLGSSDYSATTPIMAI